MLGNVLSNPSSTERERNREYEREKERLSSLRSRKRDTDGRREPPALTWHAVDVVHHGAEWHAIDVVHRDAIDGGRVPGHGRSVQVV